MRISNIKNNNSGFTLIELVIVIAGLAALGSITFPNILASLKLNKIEEAKAIMNGYAADCLGKYRISTNPVKFVEESTPDGSDETKLETLGYQIDGGKNKCAHFGIKPLNKKEKNLYAFDFRMSAEGKVLKTATSPENLRFLNSCRGWAGKNCGMSEAQLAEFNRLAKIAKAKSVCLSKYNKWLSKKSTGQFVSWDNDKQSCTRKVFAFEGTPVNSLEAVDQALKSKYGRKCLDWRISKRKSKAISKKGRAETKDPECGGIKYWFHSGKEFTSKIDFDVYDNLVKKQKCIKDRQNALRTKKKGKYVYGPTPGPSPCGNVVWLCKGKQYTFSAYKTTSCGKPTPPPNNDPPKKPEKCRNGKTREEFKVNKRCKPPAGNYKGFIGSFESKDKQCTC